MNRLLYNLLCITSILTILSSCLFPWFSLPPINSNIEVSNIEVSSIENYFKILSACLFFLILFFYFEKKSSFKDRISRYLGYFTCIYFLFPFFLQYFSSEMVARSAFLNSQHQSLSWLGGDIYTSQEYVKYGFKNNILVIDSPREIKVIDYPYLSSDTFSLSIISELLNWLGYSSHFCQFVNKGFILALFGTIFLQVLFLKDEEKVNFARAKYVLKQNFILLLSAVSFVSLLTITSGIYLSEAENKARAGLYFESRDNLKIAAQIIPIIKMNSSYVFQRGLLDEKLKIESKYQEVFIAKKKIESSKDFQAVSSLLALAKEQTPTGREARRLITRVSIDKINSNMLSQAGDLINLVLKSDPSSLKANYIAQLVSLRKEDLKKLDKLLLDQRLTYSYFNTRGKKTVLASGYENEAYLNLIKQDLNSANRAWKSRLRGR